jgi:hypothetical protein
VALTIRPHLGPKLKIIGSIPLVAFGPSWLGVGKIVSLLLSLLYHMSCKIRTNISEPNNMFFGYPDILYRGAEKFEFFLSNSSLSSPFGT